ncbi:unnamed protein product [Spodoptera littoralis]|uniref:Uncharacterized protein n=1 Tax=Spodoptera littoralis TaxID=7109 RepID=A0A9P0I7W5_SPOLI|nr:unnamed protein product [Spodoptera littoralis]CAH1642699.1 unnamed protein product [Spodoptera littoralis]
MASPFSFSYILFIVAVFVIVQCFSAQKIKPRFKSFYFVLPEINTTNVDRRSHLKFDHVMEYCKKRDLVCKSNLLQVCAVRIKENKREYKDFENDCYLFLSNMCDHPSEEYYITDTGNCTQYLASRRNDVRRTTLPTTKLNVTLPATKLNVTLPATKLNGTLPKKKNKNRIKNRGSKNAALRQEYAYSFDNHVCPNHCTNGYRPTCLMVNRMMGKYFKVWYFLNHCEADRYYCKIWPELETPPDKDQPKVLTTEVGWNFCGAFEFVQFSLFSDNVSSMHHYGWLNGNQAFTYALKPHERIPDYK